MSLATDLIRETKRLIAGSTNIFPELYSTWDYLSGENRICHHRTTALLAHAAWNLLTKPAVEMENSFTVGSEENPNRPGKQKAIKWHPDLVLREPAPHQIGNVLLFVDFESPNSSDYRIIERNVRRWYLNWYAATKKKTEYLIITSLPDRRSEWDCRYGEDIGVDFNKLCENPFRYWYNWYWSDLKSDLRKHKAIKFANFNGSRLKLVDFAALRKKLRE